MLHKMICPELCLFLCHNFEDGIHITAGDTIFYMQLTQGSPDAHRVPTRVTVSTRGADWVPRMHTRCRLGGHMHME